MSHDIVDKFSTQLKNVLTRALCFVVETNRKTVEPEHLLWALGTQKGCVAAEILHKANVKHEALRHLVADQTMAEGDGLVAGDALMLRLSDEAKRMLEKAVLTANVFGHRYVGTEHLLSGMLQIRDTELEAFFVHSRADMKVLREQIALVLKSISKFPDFAQAITEGGIEEKIGQVGQVTEVADTGKDTKKTPALDYFGRNLTSKALQANIDPVIGREQEIQRVMEVLCRRTKNNPLLLGDPGVGKTAIVEGLAKKIFEDDVPLPLRDKRVVALDLALIVAGTMYRGEFEARVRQIVEEARANPDIILFVDELHTIVGAGASSGSLDAANILKPSLARGEIRMIGATTTAEFKKHIENDNALERRFQSVFVEEPNAEKSVEILRGVAPGYEAFHGVRISPAAIDSAVRLSTRYIQDKRLPDKALDLLDEAAASARVRADEPGPVEHKRLLQRELSEVRETKRQAVVEEHFLEAIALKEEEERLYAQLNEEKARLVTVSSRIINEEDVVGVIARMTGIPLEDLLDEERKHVLKLEDKLREKVLGQDQAVERVAASLKRAKTGIAHPSRPLASFLFLGPSGVGKTELAKAIAQFMLHDVKALIRLDMSEFSEGFTVSKLIGAPAGYVGYRESAKLTDAVKQRPFSVVLFDEIEKAHRDVQNLLLQILEEGEITDATGRKVNFKNTVIVLTSNVGLERFERGGMGFTSSDAERAITLDQDLRKELEERFRPELLNRLDHTCLFQPLSSAVLLQIAQKQLAELTERLTERDIRLQYDEPVAAHIASLANAKFGARDIRRKIETEIEHKIAERLLTSSRPGKLALTVRGKKIVFSKS